MAWQNLPTNYTDAVWTGNRKFEMIDNGDDTVSFEDVTQYTQYQNSFFGATDANKMNNAINVIMAALEDGTDLYTDFEEFFNTQSALFVEQADTIINEIATREEAEFDTWFDHMKDQLSEDAAGHLQMEIDELQDEFDDPDSWLLSAETKAKWDNILINV